jgi:chemotaxis response regulator CheB
MLSNKRVLIVSGDVVGGQALIEAVELVKGRVVGPAVNAAEAMPLLVSARPDVVVIDYGSAGSVVMTLLTQLLTSGTPVVICAEPGLLPEFRGDHPTLAVLSTPVRPMRVVGRIAMLLRL